jgi:hypothetical protein
MRSQVVLDLAPYEVVPSVAASPLRLHLLKQPAGSTFRFMRTADSEPVLQFQAKRAFAGVSELVLKNLVRTYLEDGEGSALDGEFTDLNSSDHLALLLMCYFLPGLDMSGAIMKMMQRVIEEDVNTTFLDCYDMETIMDFANISQPLNFN